MTLGVRLWPVIKTQDRFDERLKLARDVHGPGTTAVLPVW